MAGAVRLRTAGSGDLGVGELAGDAEHDVGGFAADAIELDNGGPNLTVALLTGSPAIDNGSNIYVTAGGTDQRGLARFLRIKQFPSAMLSRDSQGTSG